MTDRIETIRRMSLVGRCCSLIPGLDVKLSKLVLAGPTVLSVVGACLRMMSYIRDGSHRAMIGNAIKITSRIKSAAIKGKTPRKIVANFTS